MECHFVRADSSVRFHLRGCSSVVLIAIACVMSILRSSVYSAPQDRIRLNQLGFYTFGPKVAVAIAPATWYFTIKSTDLSTTYYTGELSPLEKWSRSGEEVKSADFSSFTRNGTYVVHIAGIGASHPFTIGDDQFSELSRGLLKAFYYQRCSTALGKEAGAWRRAAGHPDNSVIIHESAQSDPANPGARKTGETYPSPKGWYDAGDFGKYVVNAGITTYELLLLHEQFPEYSGKLNLGIPESGNDLPDLLDEIKWELDWLLTMQDPADGGIYHKVTTKNFTGDIMPDAARAGRYFIGKGSAATFDFAAVLATSYRVYQQHLPDFADTCLAAARRAWDWGMQYPDSAFSNPEDVVTGEYGDRGMRDERAWAGYELFCATGDSTFLTTAREANAGYRVPEWPNVGMLGYYSMALLHNDSAAVARITSLADGLHSRTVSTPYRTTLNNEFYWGSNGVVANQGMLLLVAYLLTKDTGYLEAAIHAIDYLLGRNATGYSYVTGFGKRPPMHPHHRPSTADKVAAPVPGLLVGGPNRSASDGCDGIYSAYPAKAWRDEACSYSTNEIAINWNAPAAFLAGGISAVFASDRFDLLPLRTRYTKDTIAPEQATITPTDIGANEVTLSIACSEPTVTTIQYSFSSDFSAMSRHYLARADSTTAVLSRLLPETVYYYRCLFVDAHGNSTESAVDSFRTETGSFQMQSIIRHRRGSCISGSPLTLSFEHEAIVSARVDYALGGDTSFTSLPFARSGTTFSTEIPGKDITPGGIRYTFTVADTSGTITTPRFAAVPDSFSLSKDPFGTREAYAMVSLPGAYPPQASLPLFAPQFGDTAQWRYFGYDPGHSRYTVNDSLAPGTGGWFYTTSPHACAHSAKSLPPDTLFPVVLHRGWNLIGNPFTFPIYWSNGFIDLDGALVNVTDKAGFFFVHHQIYWYHDTLVSGRHSGSYRTNRELTSHTFNDSTVLEPWKAYWVYTEADSTVLLLNPEQQPVTPSLPKRAAPLHWCISIRASCESLTDNPVVFGCSDAASDGYDPYDAPKPPSPVSKLSAAFVHNDWNTAVQRFASDITGTTLATNHSWYLEVRSSQQKPVTLSWNATGAFPDDLFLVDSASGTVSAMDATGSCTVFPHGNRSSRTIVFTRAAGAHPDLLPVRWTFSRIPGKQVHFVYTIPAAEGNRRDVSITVFDLYGRTVRMLPVHTRTPGIHRCTWDGRASGGTTAASGMYIVRFSAGAFTQSIPITLSR